MAESERFADARFLILTSLASGPKHGYAMITDIAAFSGTRLGPGTLYTALQRLENDGLIAPMAADERKRPYRITHAGLGLLRTSTNDLRRVAGIATRRMAPR